MYEKIKQWLLLHDLDAQFFYLVLILIGTILGILLLIHTALPIFVALVFTYLLDNLVTIMERYYIKRSIGAGIIVILMICTVLFFLILLPILLYQLSAFLKLLPDLVERLQLMLNELTARYPLIFGDTQPNVIIDQLREYLRSVGADVLSFSIANLTRFAAFFLYLFLVPLVVYFMLKDKLLIIRWMNSMMPIRSSLLVHLIKDVDIKFSGYIRGKCMEILIVWCTTYVVFIWLDLRYALLLSALVGFSVVMPYVGAFVVTIPVMLVAFAQWGLTIDFVVLMFAYTIIQTLDGNVLVPILFSEVVKLHPLAIVIAILFFGSLWGLWGVFFAIPLATLIQVMLDIQRGNRTTKQDLRA